MGECVSYSKLCCPTDKTLFISEIASPRMSQLRIGQTPLYVRRSLSELKRITTDVIPDSPLVESPEPKMREAVRRNTCIERKRSFLAKARERNRKSSQLTVVNFLSEFEANMCRTYTFTEEKEDLNRSRQLRVSIDSPLQHNGDYEVV